MNATTAPATESKKQATTKEKVEKIVARKPNSFQSFDDGTSKFTRKDLPSIVDNTDKLVQWIVTSGYKVDTIEIIGNKPASWDQAFGIAVATVQEA